MPFDAPERPHPSAAQMARLALARVSRGVDHREVAETIRQRGARDGAYILMTMLSAGIATLGLLLSSPAVVIGAMLLSPLMAPIVLLGFSFWTVEWSSTLRAGARLLLGFVVALGVAVLLTWVSPLKEPTAEILARARPTLFDLLVAVFSGLAGGYAEIRRRGETAIAVAIATALMPPIATVGFGIGTGNWAIAQGALLLFATNLVAIALAVAGVAALYGFRPHPARNKARWLGQAAVILVLVGLCVPLTLSLEQIALESRITTSARKAIHAFFGPKARLTSLQVRADDGAITVNGLIATPKFVSGASDHLARVLRGASRKPVHVSLDQVVLAHPTDLDASPPPRAAEVSPLDAVRAAIPFDVQTVSYDPKTQAAVVLLGEGSGLDLSGAFALESSLRKRGALPQISVIPPVAPLPPISLSTGPKGQIVFGDTLTVNQWAMYRWSVGTAVALLCGDHAPPTKKILAALAESLAIPVERIVRGNAKLCPERPRSPQLYLSALGSPPDWFRPEKTRTP